MAQNQKTHSYSGHPMFSIRYQQLFQARKALMHTCGILQGKKVHIIDKDFEAHLPLLKNSNRKGTFIERFITYPAWQPTLSIESMDGETWKTLQHQFRRVFTSLPWKTELPKIIEEEIRFVTNPVIDNYKFRKILAQILHRLVFEFKADESTITLICDASIEWSKELALKGKGCSQTKELFWQHFQHLTRNSRHYPDQDLSHHQEIILMSAIAQPIFISPLINICDIFASVTEIITQDPQWEAWLIQKQTEGSRSSLLHFLFEAIRVYHPFPILERELTKDMKIHGKDFLRGEQIFFVLDTFQINREIQPDQWEDPQPHQKAFLFGAGPRGCVGQQLAELLIQETLWNLVQNHISLKHLNENANISGRINDSNPLPNEGRYQFTRMGSLIKQSLNVRLTRTSL